MRKTITEADRKKARQKIFFWLLKNCKDFSDYHTHSYSKIKGLPKIDDDFIDQGPVYDTCTEKLLGSVISFDDKVWRIRKAMAPLRMKKMAETREKFDVTDQVLLFLESSNGSMAKFLLNVHGDIYSCAEQHPCACCGYYSISKESCHICEKIQEDEKEEGKKEWMEVNNQMFELHKHRIPQEFHRMYEMEDDPVMQCMFLNSMLNLASGLEEMRKKEEEKKLFTDNDFPPLSSRK